MSRSFSHPARLRGWPLVAVPLALVLGALVLDHPRALAAESAISFNRDVRPILSDRCFFCHGPDADNQKSEFRIDTLEHATADLGGYAGIVPGDLEKSEVHLLIHATHGDQMPPPKSNRKLSEREKEILDQWIREGAPFDSHWAFEPLPAEVEVPEAKDTWARNEVDRFIQAAWPPAGLVANAETTRENWLRRATFDLTGLPPTLEELDTFLADQAEGADARAVDRLLAGDACAERLTSEWLDVARYSDSYGYQRDDERFVWPWRDWVIGAFRQNMPYDQFITEQLAGDLLPQATRDQVLATAFNRLHSHNKEGGVALEEFRVENVADRTHTVAAAFLGLTAECARCHDHKYDPLKTREYYELSSFFANIDERGLISYFTDAVPTPAMPLPSPEQESALQAAARDIAKAEKSLAAVEAAAAGDFEVWLRAPVVKEALPGMTARLAFESLDAVPEGRNRNEEDKERDSATMRSLANEAGENVPALTTAANRLVTGRDGTAIALTGDDAVWLPGVGRFDRHHPFSVSLWMKAPNVMERSVIWRRSRGWDDAGTVGYELVLEDGRLSAKVCHFWPGDAICVETPAPSAGGEWWHVTVTYDGSSKASGLKIFTGGAEAATTIVADCLTRSTGTWREGYEDLAIGARYRDRGFKGGLVDDFVAFDRALSALEVRQLADGKSLNAALAAANPDVDAEQREALKEYYLSAVSEPVLEARLALNSAREKWNGLMDAIPAITVMREQPEPRPAFVLTRGAYDQHGEAVTADTPDFLPPFPAGAPRNRLGLAQWLTAPDHPLTARVTVNRYWQMIFGRGLVSTPEDFGNQSAPPTHPELLDWLARDFVDHGWNVHRLLRQLVLSSTYRQSADVPPPVRAIDPENLLLARAPAQRLTAEMIRDSALAVAGLLRRDVGGPPVKPYDLPLAYTPSPADTGAGLYRRSLYTFWRRTAPSPVLITLNANRRDVCRLRREITHSPLQALVMLNGPQFIEAARVLAETLVREFPENSDAMLQETMRRLISRTATEPELNILRGLLDDQIAHFSAEPESAKSYLATGETSPAQDLPGPRLAAVTVLVNTMMNFDENVRNR